MKTYPKMKDSGVEWIGEIPEHWTKVTLKHVCKIQKGKIPSEIYDEKKDGYIPYLTMDYIRSSSNPKYVKINEGIIVDENDLLILYDGSKSGEVFKGKQGILSSTMGILNQRSQKFESKYFFYQLKFLEKDIQNNTVGMGIPHVDGEYIRNLKLVSPPKDEQKKISAYLEIGVKKIDSKISEMGKLIVLLKEKKKSLINQSITKGLDLSVKMKDSGIERIGEIPEHWKLTKLKDVCKIERGRFTHRPRNDPSLYNGKYPFIQTGDVENSNGEITDYRQTLNEKGIKVSKEFPKNTVVMTIAANIGSTAVTTFPVYFPDSIVGFYSEEIDTYFLRFYLQNLKVYLEGIASSTTQKNINYEFLKPLPIGIPENHEQKQISDYLNKKTKHIEHLIYQITKEIKKLKEFRQSVITLVVTGKIDVREVVA